MTEETKDEGEADDQPVESGDVIVDQSETGEVAADGRGEKEGEGEGVRVRKTSRPATADRKSLSWEEVGGGREREEGGGGGEEREEREGEKMRRPSLHSAEETGAGVRLNSQKIYNFIYSQSVIIDSVFLELG